MVSTLRPVFRATTPICIGDLSNSIDSGVNSRVKPLKFPLLLAFILQQSGTYVVALITAHLAAESFCLQQEFYPLFDLVSDHTHLFNRQTLGVFQRPVISSQARNVGAVVSATHGDE